MRHGDDLVSAHDERPRLALRAGNLGVDKHVLDLLPPAGEPVARPPASYLKACQLGFDPPPAPANGPLERDRAALEPGAVVLADELDAVAEIESLRTDGRRDQLGEGRLQGATLLERPQQVRVGGRVKLAQEWQDPVADQASGRVPVRAVRPVREAEGLAVRRGLVPPDRQQGANDAVLALRLDPGRAAACHQPVENRLDLVGSGMAGGSKAIGGEAVADLAQFLLRRAATAVHDLGAHQLTAEAGVFLGFRSTQAVVDVQRGDAVPELAENVPRTGRVGTAGNEHGHIAAGRDQLQPLDLSLHAGAQVGSIHGEIVAARSEAGGETSRGAIGDR